MSWQDILKLDMLFFDFILDYMEAYDLTVNAKDEPAVVEGIVRKLTDDEKDFIIDNGPTFNGTVHNGVAEKINDGVNAHNKMQERLQWVGKI